MTTLRSGWRASTWPVSRPHTRGVGGVDLDRIDIRMLGGDLLEQFGPSAPDNHGVARGVQAQRQSQTDSTGRTGNEDGVSSDVHACVPFVVCQSLPIQRQLVTRIKGRHERSIAAD